MASGLARVLTGSDTGGLGVAMPLLVVTTLLAMLGIVGTRLARRFRSSPPGT
jgi:hypothetical protein